MVIEVIGNYWKFWFELKEITYPLQNLSAIEARIKETLNIEVVGKFVRFLKRVETQSFDIG
jgi:hypothetical protein